ncbi:MAG: phosphodiester glycosidase family protein [Flavobacterium sp.]
MKKRLVFLFFLILISSCFFQFSWKAADDDFVFYEANPKQENVRFYLKDDDGNNFGSIAGLKASLAKDKKELLFAMNGGMYKKDKSPQGLFIENSIVRNNLDTADGGGNFYLKPNGVFFIDTNNRPGIVKTEDFKYGKNVLYATQSGPMLLIDGETHKAFSKDSRNLNIRNGVGILPNGRILFAMSKKEISFYDFAQFFKNKGCKNALYLDGFVSRAYCPKQDWVQTDGDFGVIIGVTKSKI